MSTNPICPKCWYTNLAGTQFCYHCGTLLPKTQPTLAPLTGSPTPPPTAAHLASLSPASSSYGSTDYFSYFMEKKRREGIYRTKTGLLLLTIGIFLGLGNLLVYLRGTSILGNILLALGILGLGVVGGILSIIGAVLVILGREVFGKTHSSQVLWSVGLFLGGIAIAVISGFLFSFAFVESIRNGGGARLQDSLVSSFYAALIGSFIGGAISGLAYVLVTYSLQRSQGRIVLWAAYIARVVVGLVTLFYISSQVSSAVQAAFSSGTPNLVPILSLQTKVRSFTSLNSIITAAYGVVYLLVWSRINKGEIPLAHPPATSQ